MRENLSDNAVRLWMSHFVNPKSTLSFGGDGARMEITAEARDALNELLACGAAKAIPPLDAWPNREHYGGGDTCLRDVLADRPHLNPFKDEVRFVTFRKKEAA